MLQTHEFQNPIFVEIRHMASVKGQHEEISYHQEIVDNIFTGNMCIYYVIFMSMYRYRYYAFGKVTARVIECILHVCYVHTFCICK